MAARRRRWHRRHVAVVTEPRISRVMVSDETITAHLADGRGISVPLAWSWRLSDATPTQRANWKIIGNGHGVHWPDVDEDISVDGMLNGIPARRPDTVRPASKSAVSERRARPARGRQRR